MMSISETNEGKVKRLIKISKRYTANQLALEAYKFHIASEVVEVAQDKKVHGDLQKLLTAVTDLSDKMQALEAVIQGIEKKSKVNIR